MTSLTTWFPFPYTITPLRKHNQYQECLPEVCTKDWTSNYIPQYLWDVITCPCPDTVFWYSTPNIIQPSGSYNITPKWINEHTCTHFALWLVFLRLVSGRLHPYFSGSFQWHRHLPGFPGEYRLNDPMNPIIVHDISRGPISYNRLNLIPVWISYHMPS